MKAKKGKTMQKNKKDPVKDFQKQAVDQRVCLFYVADRVKGILEDSKTEVVQGTCPTCRERTMLISLTKEIYRCITCGGDLRQYINGKISYIPTTNIRKDVEITTKNG